MNAIAVGNDIVDLGDPRTEGRATDRRFVERVFDHDEQTAIRAASDGDLELWARWAAKETAFKVVSKLIGTPPPFVHRAFKVEWTRSVDAPAPGELRVVREGLVTYAEHLTRVSVELWPGAVHAIGFATAAGPPERATLHPSVGLLDSPDSPWSGTMEELQKRFTERELDAVYSTRSAAVRLGARADLARALVVDEARLEIVCDPGPPSRRPPRVLLDGDRTGADVSLSHDGRWIAWVIWTDNDTEDE